MTKESMVMTALFALGYMSILIAHSVGLLFDDYYKLSWTIELIDVLVIIIFVFSLILRFSR